MRPTLALDARCRAAARHRSHPRLAAGLIAASCSAVVLPLGTADAATLAQTKARLKSQVAALPGSTSVFIREAATQTVLGSRTPSTRRIPASVTKLFTTSTALLQDGPTATLATELRASGEIDADGVLQGDLIVKGAGDPSFSTAGVDALAEAAKDAGIVRIAGTLRADLGTWTTQQGTPLTRGRYNGEIGGRLGALVVARGFASASVTDPSRQVLVRLRDALKAGGLKGNVTFGSALRTSTGSTLLGTVKSPTIFQLISATNQPSDNFYAEELLRGVGARHGAGGTTAAGLAVERAHLRTLGVNARLVDGSGLARGNRVAPSSIVRLLDQMASRTEGGQFRASLALAGATGTLASRMRGTAASGRCRAKTGTLSNVSALAGWCTTMGGRNVAFAILQNKVNVATARSRQDAIAATIAGWSDKPVADLVTPVPSPSNGPTSTTPAGTSPAAGGGALAR
ncbi:MAG: D-alanyl-D-alanine carboxypeptidase/D-alanyl-D-alanine-endopeptidase [Solirubrobacteraceae bacterium]|nr:D-alanyl-D-alanine carboxypeptidase/D-alanyl-D-alanine-endopeptidase [Solirubrobacteraceae bacterium]